MANSAEELSIIETALAYNDSGTTHMEPEIMLNPVQHYADPERLHQEVDILFREFPIILGHSGQLAEPGAYFTHDTTGVPILVTRNRAGQVKAMINVCRHRGARVVNESCGTASTFACPYHAWTYDLDGSLRGVRHPERFGTVDKQSHGLVELPAFERYGLIWVRPSVTEEELDIDAWLAPMAEQLGSLDMQDHVIFREWTLQRDMSWRIALEGFQETYHFCSAHKHTACSSYLDDQAVYIDQYPHVRNAVPLSSITRLKDQARDTWDYRPNFMTQNYLFPCNFVQVMTDHIYVHTIIPTGQGRCAFQCMMLIPESATSDKAMKYWEANYNVVKTVFDEDFEIGENIQKGLATGVNEHFVIGRNETSIQLSRKAIDDALAGRLACNKVKPDV